MEKIFCGTKKVIAILMILLTIGIFSTSSSQAVDLKTCLKYMKEGYKCTYTGTAMITYKSKSAAKKSNIFKLGKFLKRGETVKIYEVDGNVVKIGESRYISLTESSAKRFSFASKITRATSLEIKNVKNGKLTLGEGKSKQLEFVIKPENTTLKNVNWKSSNNKIAEIDNKGKIKAKKSGKVKITGTIDGVESSFTLEVVSYKYSFNGNTYKLAVLPTDLDSTIKAIETKKVYQNNGWKNLGEAGLGDNTCTDYKCYRIALCHLHMLLDSSVRKNIKHTGIEAWGSYSDEYQEMGSDHYYWTSWTPNIVKDSIDARNTSNNTYLFYCF